MPFTENQLKGNWGEQYVAERLAACGCLIRHVPQGHDSGLDLYCESTKDGLPFLHFWCQVKVRQEFATDTPTNQVRVSPEGLNYWLSQPVPVIIALVPDKPGENPPLYFCPPGGLIFETKNNVITASRRIETKAEMQSFLDRMLAVETYLWELHHGKVTTLKTSPLPSYGASMLIGASHLFEPKLLESIRQALWRLAEDILRRHYSLHTLEPLEKSEISHTEAVNGARPYVQALEALMEGKRLGNYENLLTIGFLAEMDGDFAKAENMYCRSLASIEGDKQLDCSQMPWAGFLGQIQLHLNRAKQKLSHQTNPPTTGPIGGSKS